MLVPTALYLCAILTVAIGVAHSYLGERYILIRLFRRPDLPQLFGGTEFTLALCVLHGMSPPLHGLVSLQFYCCSRTLLWAGNHWVWYWE